MRVYACICVYMRVYACICVYMRVYACICVYIIRAYMRQCNGSSRFSKDIFGTLFNVFSRRWGVRVKNLRTPLAQSLIHFNSIKCLLKHNRYAFIHSLIHHIAVTGHKQGGKRTKRDFAFPSLWTSYAPVYTCIFPPFFTFLGKTVILIKQQYKNAKIGKF